MGRPIEKQAEHRRGGEPEDEDYLGLVGERLRITRTRRGMSRKVLSVASGVSERYLAEMERGAGNASLLVVRRLAAAMGIRVADFCSDEPDRPVDLHNALTQLEQLTPVELAEARAWLAAKLESRPSAPPKMRIAFVGLRGAGKSTLGKKLGAAMSIPFVELDREIERASGMELSELFQVYGQGGFRQLEYDCLQQILANYDRCVIATGGSLVTEPRSFDLLLACCHVVWLRAAPEQHVRRVADRGDTDRPVPSPQVLDELQAILTARAELYARAHTAIDTGAVTEAEALEQIRALAALRG